VQQKLKLQIELIAGVEVNNFVVTSISELFVAITAELVRALAVVKVTLQVNGNSQFSGVCPPKTIGAVKIKSGTIDSVGKGTHMQNLVTLVTLRLLGVSPHIGEI